MASALDEFTHDITLRTEIIYDNPEVFFFAPFTNLMRGNGFHGIADTILFQFRKIGERFIGNGCVHDTRFAHDSRQFPGINTVQGGNILLL